MVGSEGRPRAGAWHLLEITGVFKGGVEGTQGSVLGSFPDFTLNPC